MSRKHFLHLICSKVTWQLGASKHCQKTGKMVPLKYWVTTALIYMTTNPWVFSNERCQLPVLSTPENARRSKKHSREWRVYKEKTYMCTAYWNNSRQSKPPGQTRWLFLKRMASETVNFLYRNFTVRWMHDFKDTTGFYVSRTNSWTRWLITLLEPVSFCLAPQDQRVGCYCPLLGLPGTHSLQWRLMEDHQRYRALSF